MTAILPTPAVSAQPTAPELDTRVSVPWSQVLPLAVLLAFGNGFWIIVLRGAVGAIERTSDPFSSWLRESALLVPVYVVAVLVAFVVALRWLGRRSLGLGGTALVIAAVAVSGTIAGVLLQAGSSVLDYRLQAAALNHMSIAHPGCDPSCLAARKDATSALLIESVGVGALLMLLTGLVLVGLLVAFRGGRVVLAGSRAPRELALPPLRVFLAAALVGAAAIHAAVIPEHLREWWAAGVFFIVLTAVELLAAVVLLSRRRWLQVPSLLVTVAVSIGPLLVWWVSRTSGLPFGPESGEAEAVGVADVMACLLELVAFAVALGLVLARDPEPARWTPYRTAIALASIVALTAIGLGGSGIAGFGSFTGGDGHSHGEVGEAGTLR